MILGLTGNIASGKSTVSNYFIKLGITVIDADLISKKVSKDKDIVDKLITSFGELILLENKELNRKKLREIVFQSPEKIKLLNSIMHPKIIEYFEKMKKEDLNDSLIIFDIPLLFELKLEYLCDRILLVYSSEEIQIDRIIKRDNSTYEIAKKIIGSQKKVETKILKADYIIENSGTIEELKIKFEDFYKNLIIKKKGL